MTTGKESVFDFEAVYRKYPRKEGKSRGMSKLRTTIKDEATYDAFIFAAESYIALCHKERREPKFIKHWGTFVNNWTDYLTKDLAVKSVTETQLEKILKGEL